MPTSAEILASLAQIANDWTWLAIVWHTYFGFALVYNVFWTQSVRTKAATFTLPTFSVSGLAWLSGNPFNAIVFALLGIGLCWSIYVFRSETHHQVSTLINGVGAFLFLFGWLYPHFLEAGTPIAFLYASPLGLIPCPTLSAMIGISLLFRLDRVQIWSLILSLVGLFYGIFGAFRLGVAIDSVLIFGSIVLLVITFRSCDRKGI